MGINDLLPLLRDNDVYTAGKRKDQLKATDLGNRRLGLDVSVAMHKMISRTHFAIAFHQKPPLCLQEHVNAHFNHLLKFSSELDIQFIFVCDGKKHPLKQTTDNV